MNVNTITGVDIDNRWLLRGNDLLLVDGYDNLSQAIQNRLSCVLDDMAYFYDGYGSKLHEFFGKPLAPSLMQDIANEVVTCLSGEPRLTEVKCEVTRVGQNEVLIKVYGIVDENSSFDYNFLLNEYTYTLETIGWDTTQLELHIGLWDCIHQENIIDLRKGESILIQCRVLNSHGNPVPIGEVEYWISGVHRIVEVNDGRADLLFEFPDTWENGEYTIEAKYKGLGKFSQSYDSMKIYLDNQWKTETELVFENNYGFPYQEVMFPTTVNDIVGGKVRDGDVNYYLNWVEKLRTKINANNWYTTTPTKGKAIWSEAVVYDEWDNYAQCGCINFYIENLEGMLKATKTILRNGYILNGTNHTFLNSFTYDEDYERVCGGEVNFSYRELPQILETITDIVEDPLMVANSHDARIRTLVTDEDGIGVLDSDVDYYVRKCGKCYPYDTITNTQNTYLTRDKSTFTHSTVVDEDYYPVPNGDVVYSLEGLPIAVITPDIDAFVDGARYGAMIVDMNDNVVDVGSLITETGVTSYVTNPEEEDNPDKIKFKLTGVVNNG